MDATNIAGTTLDALAAAAEQQETAPAINPPKRGRGRPPGSKTRTPQISAAPAAPAIDPAVEARLEQRRQRAAEQRAKLPGTVAKRFFKLTRGYKGKAFDLTTDEIKHLADEYRNAQRAIAGMDDGWAKTILEIAIGSEDGEGDGVFWSLLYLGGTLQDQFENALEKMEAELADESNRGSNRNQGNR